LNQANGSVSILPMLRNTIWRPGPARSTDGSVVVSLTDYTAHKWRDLPGVWRSGLRLARSWPRRQGSVGLWLWADPLRRRSGSISIWTNEEDLQRFVRWPVHVAIMRKYRSRGTLTASSWDAERFDRAEVLREAERRLLR
jgi:hypothetical protein